MTECELDLGNKSQCLHARVCACTAGCKNGSGNSVLAKSKICSGCVSAREFLAPEEKTVACKTWSNQQQVPSVREALQGWRKGTGTTRASEGGQECHLLHRPLVAPVVTVREERGWTPEPSRGEATANYYWPAALLKGLAGSGEVL